MARLKSKYPTHYALVTALTRQGFIADLMDTDRYTHADGTTLRASFNGAWVVRAVA